MPRTIHPTETTGRIALWRLVGGVFLHVLVPFYLLAIALDLVFFGPRPATGEAVLRHIVSLSPALLGAYATTAAAATIVAAVVEPMLSRRRERRQARDPGTAARRSEHRLRRAILRGKGAFGAQADEALVRLEEGWAPGDARFQAISRDLEETIEASLRAVASAPAERRADLARMASTAIERLANSHDALVAGSAHEDEQQARIVARYVETRYGHDSSGEAF